jgi:hypothetical protein
MSCQIQAGFKVQGFKGVQHVSMRIAGQVIRSICAAWYCRSASSTIRHLLTVLACSIAKCADNNAL